MKPSLFTLPICCSIVLSLAAMRGAHAIEPILIDDFDDGDDVGWTHVDLTLGTPWGSGTFDATSESYVLQSAGEVGVGQLGILVSTWNTSDEPLFNDGYLRARVRSDTPGTNVKLMLRADADAPTGYFFGTTEFDEFSFFRCDPECTRFTTLPGVQFQRGRDWQIEAGAVGDQLTMKVWADGEPIPSAPQLTLADSTHSSGQFGVLAYIGGNWQVPAQVNGVFDDIYFTPAFQPGDTNGDGNVDINDLNAVRNNFGATGAADGSLVGDTVPWDGQLNIDDLNAVRNHFGAGTPAAVPEPGAGMMAVFGVAAAFATRRWRQPRRGDRE